MRYKVWTFIRHNHELTMLIPKVRYGSCGRVDVNRVFNNPDRLHHCTYALGVVLYHGRPNHLLHTVVGLDRIICKWVVLYRELNGSIMIRSDFILTGTCKLLGKGGPVKPS